MTDSYTTLTIHWINESWELPSKVLFTKEMSDRHAGENLASFLKPGSQCCALGCRAAERRDAAELEPCSIFAAQLRDTPMRNIVN